MNTFFTFGPFRVIFFTAFNDTLAVDEFKIVSTGNTLFSSVFEAPAFEFFTFSLESQEISCITSDTDILISLSAVGAFWEVEDAQIETDSMVEEEFFLALITEAILVVGGASVDYSVTDSISFIEIWG